MRKISHEIDLRGKFERISATDFRQSPGEVLDSVHLGKTFLITKSGKPWAVIGPLPGPLTIVVKADGGIDYAP
jgi:prevent-host-death family protein